MPCLEVTRALEKLHAGQEHPGRQTDVFWKHLLCSRSSLAARTCIGLPATLAILRASWFFGVLERFWLRCLPPVDRMLRRWTSVALKKATMKGCLFWGPCRPIRPANLGLMLCPAEDRSLHRGVGTGKGWGHDSILTSYTSSFMYMLFIHLTRTIWVIWELF